MIKLIIYYRSNVLKELAFYEKKMTELEIMEIVQLALAKPIDDNYDDTIELITKRTIFGKVISKDNVKIIIEPL